MTFPLASNKNNFLKKLFKKLKNNILYLKFKAP